MLPHRVHCHDRPRAKGEEVYKLLAPRVVGGRQKTRLSRLSLSPRVVQRLVECEDVSSKPLPTNLVPRFI